MIHHSPERATRVANDGSEGTSASNEDANAISDKNVTTISGAPKIPPPLMDTSNLEGFFLSVEYWFAAAGILDTQDAKRFNFVMAQVPQKTLVELKSKLEMLPAKNKYDFAKRTLTEHFSESQQRRMQRVLSEMALGDAKPSQLYYDMRRVANRSISDELLLDLWAARLPANIQQLVVANQGPASEKLAIADAVMESQRWRPINAIETAPKRGQLAEPGSQRNEGHMHAPCLEAWNEIKSELSNIKALISNGSHCAKRSSTPARHSRESSPRRTRSTSRTGSNTGLCWYHEHHGARATKCRHPCTFKVTSNQP
ncbi:uncharacterized protein LOC131291497 [Anopheles ziemanni]|uniref:uncharacterized protein LOC131269839 n=1 Tax=Anopheles coustani TaxID=139045 RepID=UPI00265A83A8|nr:uncharacterized protein LOC131269839 [Anopheles coustani]XP_058176699.1 uncharacterized protein LOC131291497 [Anopheles ziemanni]